MKIYKLRKDNAFTIIELLVALLIMSVLIAIALPINRELIDSSNRNLSLRLISSDISKAQALAINTGNRVIISFGNQGQSYSYGVDVFPYNQNFTADSLVVQKDLPSKISLTLSNSIIFNPRGMVINDSELLVAHTIVLNQNGEQFKSLTLYPTGVIE